EDPGGVEELGDLPGERGPTGVREAQPATERLVEFGEDQPVGDPVLERQSAGNRPLLLLELADLATDTQRPVEDPLLQGRSGRHAGQDLRIHLLEDARNAADEVGPDLPEVLGDL